MRILIGGSDDRFWEARPLGPRGKATPSRRMGAPITIRTKVFFWGRCIVLHVLVPAEGSGAVEHYKAMSVPAHRADFFRYVLMFFEGGCYFDMKSALLTNLSAILEVGTRSLVTCIGAAGAHIHQGILIAPPRHPLLLAALIHALTIDPAKLTARQGYMTFCNEMWRLLSARARETLHGGMNETDFWGPIELLVEKKERKGVINTCFGRGLPYDGHVAWLVQGDAQNKVVAIRCWNWNRGVGLVTLMFGAHVRVRFREPLCRGYRQ